MFWKYAVILIVGLIGSITNYRKLILQEKPKDAGVKLFDGVFYRSQDPVHPEVSVRTMV